MAGSRLPGPLCRTLKDWGWIDSGTTCRQATHPPGPILAAAKVIDPNVEEMIKKNYLGHARDVSYAMQAKALVSDDLVLGGTFLRMYLDGKLDQDAADEAGEEIAKSATYRKLAAGTNERIQSRVDKKLHRLPTEKEVADIARWHLKKLRDRREGISFRGPLNPVVGGISDIDVGPKARFIHPEGQEGDVVEYEFDVTISDEYDFDNERSGEYDLYRKRLARLLQENNFWEFDKAYFGEVMPIDSWHKTKIRSNAALFASYMYALEKRGWTPGPLPWKTTIPMTGTIHREAKTPAKSKKKKLKMKK